MKRVAVTGRVSLLACGFGLVCGLALAGCGGSTPGPAEPGPADPVLTDEPTEVAEASSSEVQKGIDAIQAEDFAAAKEILLAAVKQTPEDPQAVFYLGVAQASLGETEDALAQMAKALELKADFTEASINYSALLVDSGKSEEALQAAEAGLKHAPSDTNLLQNKGLALFDLGKSSEAADVLAKVVEKAPDNEEIRFVYAQSLLAKGDEAKAVAELERLSDSKSIEVLASAADLFGRAKAWDQCVKALDKATGMQAAAELFVKRGLCKHGRDDEDGAKADFEKAIELDAQSPKGYFYLAQNLKGRGDKKGAKQAFQKVVELDPSGQLGGASKKALQGL